MRQAKWIKTSDWETTQLAWNCAYRRARFEERTRPSLGLGCHLFGDTFSVSRLLCADDFRRVVGLFARLVTQFMAAHCRPFFEQWRSNCRPLCNQYEAFGSRKVRRLRETIAFDSLFGSTYFVGGDDFYRQCDSESHLYWGVGLMYDVRLCSFF